MNRLIVTLSLICFLSISLKAQVWTQKASLTGSSRINPVSFSIGSKGYVLWGTQSRASGSARYSDMWEYDTTSNTWTQRASAPGTGRTGGIGFEYNGKGYAGLGWDGTSTFSDIREYDPINNSWLLETTYQGAGGRNSFAALLNDKLYVGGGSTSNGSAIQSDFWVYDFSNSSWTRITTFPIGARTAGVSFAYGNSVYFGMGHNGSSNFNDLWSYNTVTGLWSQMSSFPGVARIQPVSMVIGNKVIIGSGHQFGVGNALSDFWEYDFNTNTWTQLPTFASATRSTSTAFTIGNKGYVTCGFDQTNNAINDLWKLGSLITTVDEKKTGIQALEVYPIPANSELNFEIKSDNTEQTLRLVLRDIQGKEVLVTELYDGFNTVDISTLVTATYFYSIQSAQNIVKSGKIVVHK